MQSMSRNLIGCRYCYLVPRSMTLVQRRALYYGYTIHPYLNGTGRFSHPTMAFPDLLFAHLRQGQSPILGYVCQPVILNFT
jgi:hypothetical protein